MSNTSGGAVNPRASTSEAAPEAGGGEDLMERFDAWERDADAHWGAWRIAARESYAFVANDQWTVEEKGKAEEGERLVTTINRIAPMVNAVAGAEIIGRQQVQYIPRSIEDGGVNELLTKGAEWIRDQAQADREDSEAFRDVLICGLGFTETVMSYEEEPEGRIVIARIDPLEMTADPSSRRANLSDARYLRRRRKIARTDFEQLYPGASGESAAEAKGGSRSGGDRRRAYRGDDPDESAGPDEVMLTEWQWYDLEVVHVAEAPDGRVLELSAAQRDELEAAYAQQGLELQSVTQRRRRYRRAVTAARQVLEHGDLPDGEFTIKAITGERDRNKGVWHGVVHAMKDPQRFANLFFSMLHHIIRTNAKGGILAETDAFEDPRQAEKTWARADAITWASPGAVRSGAIQPKTGPQIPPVIVQMMQFAVSGIRDASGINEELLGLVERGQAGVLEHQRKQAAYAILAGYTDSLRAYRQQQGKLLLKYMQKYLPEGYLVRITGEDGVARYAPLARMPETIKFDVVVDSAPAGPDEKQRTWALVAQMAPMLKEAGPEVWAELVKYSPFPDAVATKLSQVFAAQAAKAEAGALGPAPAAVPRPGLAPGGPPAARLGAA